MRLPVAQRQAIMLTRNPVWKATNTSPIQADHQIDLKLMALSAFDEIMHGKGIQEHVDMLATAANTCLVLCEMGHGPECEHKAIEAQHGLLRMKSRQTRGLAIAFDGAGAQAMRDMLMTMDQQLEDAGKGDLAAAIVEVHTRTAQGNVFRAGKV